MPVTINTFTISIQGREPAHWLALYEFFLPKHLPIRHTK